MARISIGRQLSNGLPQPTEPLWAIAISLIMGSLLTVYPVPYGWANLRPNIMLLLMLFWVLCQPRWCGVTFAFFMGLAVDLMQDSPLGLNAFCFVCVGFITRFLTQNKRVLTFLNLWILAAMACAGYLLLSFIMYKIMGQNLSLAHWWPFLSTLLIWPLVFLSLARWRI